MFDHKTSRLCDDPECGGILEDSIVNFGEPLPQDELQKAFSHAEKVHVRTCTYTCTRTHMLMFVYIIMCTLYVRTCTCVCHT